MSNVQNMTSRPLLTQLHLQFLTNISTIGTRTIIGQELDIVCTFVQHMTKLCPKNDHKMSRVQERCGQWPRGEAPAPIWEVQLLTNICPIISQKLDFLKILFCTPSPGNVHILSNSSVAVLKPHKIHECIAFKMQVTCLVSVAE